MKPAQTVILIIDPNFGELLSSLPLQHPVWIVETKVNSDAARRVRQREQAEGSFGGITTFKANRDLPRATQAANVIEMIDLHHGESSFPNDPFLALQVIGCQPNTEVSREFEEYGFKITQVTSDGFVAERKAVKTGK